MKSITLTILLFVSALLTSFGSDLTNGSFFIDIPVESHLIHQDGSIKTNYLLSGRSLILSSDSSILELNTSKKTTFYFSSGLIIEAGTNSIFSVDVFDEEITNLSDVPSVAKFGIYNISLTFTKGEFVVINSIGNSHSALTITTPLAVNEVDVGKYYFNVSSKSYVYVYEGKLSVHGEKKTQVFEHGATALISKISDPLVEETTTTSAITLKSDEQKRLSDLINSASKKTSDVLWIISDKKLIGIWMK